MSDEPDVDVLDEPLDPTSEPAEPALETAPEPTTEPHPLEPGGKRWNQVYRRAKDAERQNQELRERVAALEAESRVRQEHRDQQPATPQYTGDDLQKFIDENKITVGQAIDYARRQGMQEVERTFMAKLDQRDEALRQTSRLQSEIDRYVTAIPNLAKTDSDELQRAYQEYQQQVALHGEPHDELGKKRLYISALRTTFGAPDTWEQRMRSPQTSTHHETTTGTGTQPRTQQGENWWNKLSQPERDYYNKMLAQGVYQSMDDIKAEVEFSKTLTRTERGLHRHIPRQVQK